MQGAVIASTASTIPYRHNHPPPLAHGRAAPDRAARQTAFSFSAIAALPPLGLLRHKEHADFVRSQFDFWKDLLDENLGGHPLLFWDEGRGFFRFSDGRLALSRERADWRALKEAGFFSDWGM